MLLCQQIYTLIVKRGQKRTDMISAFWWSIKKRRNFAIWFLTCVYTGVVLSLKRWYFRSISFVVNFSRRPAFRVVVFNPWSSSFFMTSTAVKESLLRMSIQFPCRRHRCLWSSSSTCLLISLFASV